MAVEKICICHFTFPFHSINDEYLAYDDENRLFKSAGN